MAIKVSKIPVTETFFLEKSDPDGEATVTIRQATNDDNIKRSELFSEYQRQLGGLEIKQKYNWHVQRRYEVFLTLCGASQIVDENDEPLFKFKTLSNGSPALDMSQDAFDKAYGLLPMIVIDELHNLVTTLNPDWGSDGEGN